MNVATGPRPPAAPQYLTVGLQADDRHRTSSYCKIERDHHAISGGCGMQGSRSLLKMHFV
jgi:hypothetical protein